MDYCTIQINIVNFLSEFDIPNLLFKSVIKNTDNSKITLNFIFLIYIMQNIIDDQWVCYILKSQNPLYPNRTYVGSTNSVKRRIRQHNGELVGGAKATQIMRPNEIICVITGFTDHISTLKCEWLLKHPEGKKKIAKKYSGISGRLKGLQYLVVQSDKWKQRSGNIPLTIWINNMYIHYLNIDDFCGTDVTVYTC